jgi:hypothetical protein
MLAKEKRISKRKKTNQATLSYTFSYLVIENELYKDYNWKT